VCVCVCVCVVLFNSAVSCVFFPFCSLQYFDVVICRELRAKVCSLSTKVEKTGKLDTKLKSAFFACQTLEDVEHLVWFVVLILFADYTDML